jgi:hypothetical protein
MHSGEGKDHDFDVQDSDVVLHSCLHFLVRIRCLSLLTLAATAWSIIYVKCRGLCHHLEGMQDTAQPTQGVLLAYLYK